MFSLLITLISIALTVSLALASVYYVGSGVLEADARASASTLLSQGEQLAGAARIYKAYEQQWPADLGTLLSNNYLQAIPATGAVGWAALAMPRPAYVLAQAVDVRTCRSLNRLVRPDNGIYEQAVATWQVQCFGAEAPYSLLVQIDDPAGLAAALATAVPGATVVADASSAQFSVAPD